MNADLRLRWVSDQLNCRGGLQLQGLQVQSLAPDAAAAIPIRSSDIRLGCRDEQLRLQPTVLRRDDITLTAAGKVDLNRSFDLKLAVRRRASDDALDLSIDGPWDDPRWRLAGQFNPAKTTGVPGPIRLRGELQTPWGARDQAQVQVRNLELQGPGLQLALTGELGQTLAIESRELQVAPQFWQAVPILSTTLGRAAPLLGRLDLSGPIDSPALRLDLSQSQNPLVDRWSLQAGWSQQDSAIRLDQFESAELRAKARLPLA